jgi:hypothetical protein
MWCDGRQNHWEGRPDFPIMANAAKNGMPGFFLVSIPPGIDTTQAFPLTVWLHGGGGEASAVAWQAAGPSSASTRRRASCWPTTMGWSVGVTISRRT